jgi:hypothetical protein
MSDKNIAETSKERLIARLSVFIASADTDQKAMQFPITTLLRDVREYLQSPSETVSTLTPIEQLLTEWWSTDMDNAELFNRAVRLSPALADAMQRLPPKASEGQS